MSGREVIQERRESVIRDICYQASCSFLRKHNHHVDHAEHRGNHTEPPYRPPGNKGRGLICQFLPIYDLSLVRGYPMKSQFSHPMCCVIQPLGETRYRSHSALYLCLRMVEGARTPMSTVGLDMGIRIIVALL